MADISLPDRCRGEPTLKTTCVLLAVSAWHQRLPPLLRYQLRDVALRDLTEFMVKLQCKRGPHAQHADQAHMHTKVTQQRKGIRRPIKAKLDSPGKSLVQPRTKSSALGRRLHQQ